MQELYKKLRNEKNLTDKAVCEATGIKPSTLCDWLNGRTASISGDKAVALARFFNVELDSFIPPMKKKA